MVDKEKEAIYSRFQEYQKKKILIYGTGKIAEKIIEALEGFLIVGVVDRTRSYGEFKKKPILLWEDVKKDTAEVLNLAASQKHYETIFRRLQEKCMVCHLIVLGCAGEDLREYFGYEIDRELLRQYCGKSIEGLKAEIQNYDVISFELFDTLVMRKTLEPCDVFDLVEEKIKKEGIIIDSFKKIRMEAERLSDGGSIKEIYTILQEMLGLEKNQIEIIMEVEVQCEKELMVPRYDMAEVMAYAYQQGKIVYIISNSYMPRRTLEDILEQLGVRGFHQFYLSYEEKEKRKGSFVEVCHSKIGEDKKWLHIGCDEEIEKEKLYNMEIYQVKSALDLLRISNLHNILGYLCNINEKNVIGLLISELFNSPFSLYGTFGIVQLKKLKEVGAIFFAPLVIQYLMELFEYVNKFPEYDKVLFAARDGYLLHKLYEQFREKKEEGKKLPKAVYFFTSRKLALQATMGRSDIIQILKEYLSVVTLEELLKNVVGLEEISQVKGKETIDFYKNKMVQRAEEIEKNYNVYLENKQIDKKGKYLFCELDSQGTTQYALNHLFEVPLDGFYFIRYYTNLIYDLSIYSIFEIEKYAARLNSINMFSGFLEAILTDKTPSIKSIDKNGLPIYEKESRSKEEIEVMEEVQAGIEIFFEEFMEKLYLPGKTISAKLAETLFSYFPKLKYQEECIKLSNMALYDNLLGDSYSIQTNKKRGTDRKEEIDKN